MTTDNKYTTYDLAEGARIIKTEDGQLISRKELSREERAKIELEIRVIDLENRQLLTLEQVTDLISSKVKDFAKVGSFANISGRDIEEQAIHTGHLSAEVHGTLDGRRGPQGLPGADGAPGATGPQGPQGIPANPTMGSKS